MGSILLATSQKMCVNHLFQLPSKANTSRFLLMKFFIYLWLLKLEIDVDELRFCIRFGFVLCFFFFFFFLGKGG
jgi:hypothetical protein